MITLNYTISEQEYKDFYYYLGWLAPDRKSFRTKFYLRNLLIFVGTSIIILYINKVPLFSPVLILIQLVTIALLMLYVNWRMKSYYYAMGKKVFDDSDKENSEMIIGESGIIGKSKDTDAHYKWPAFTKKYETDSSYYLLMSSNIGLVIPKRVFKSNEERHSFEKILSQYLPLQADLPTLNS